MSELENEIAKLKKEYQFIHKYMNKLNKDLSRINVKTASYEYNLNLFFKEKSIEERFTFCIEAFKENGIKINNSFDYNDIRNVDSWNDWELDTLGFTEFKRNLFNIFALKGVSSKEKKYVPICDSIWYFAGEMEAHVKYGNFLKRLNLMSGNIFPFSEIQNILDPEYGVKFRYKEEEYTWMFKYDSDYPDFTFFDKFRNLVQEDIRDIGQGFDYYSIGENYLYINREQIGFLKMFLALNIDGKPDYMGRYDRKNSRKS